jgi:hypothetical protein
MLLAGAVSFREWLLSFRVVAFDGSGISAYLFDREWRAIEWKDVTKILCRKTVSQYTGKKSACFLVVGPRTAIIFSGDIDRFDELLERLNCYIAKNHVPAFYLDQNPAHVFKAVRWLRLSLLKKIGMFNSGVDTATSRFEL